MAVTVKFFAALRDAAGTTQVEVDPATLPQIVDGLCERYGERFATRVKIATGLLDGRPVRLDDDHVVADGSELALLPPFSGGSAVATRERRVEQLLLAGSLLLPAIVALGVFNERSAFALVVVVIGLGSLVDLHTALGDAATRTVLPAAVLLAIGPLLLLLIVPAWAGAWIPGLVALSAMLTFLLALASPRRRDTASIVGSTLVAGLFVASGTSALLLLYDVVPPVQLAGALALIALTDAAATVSARRSSAPGVREMLTATLAVATPGALAVWMVAGQPAAFMPMVGYGVAAVVAGAISARLRRTLRRRSSAGADPQPALLIGTADAVLIAAPFTLVWLALLPTWSGLG